MVVKIVPYEKGNPPGKLADAELHFTEGVLEGLKLIGYRDFMSLECGVVGDKMVEIPKAVKFLRKQWHEA